MAKTKTKPVSIGTDITVWTKAEAQKRVNTTVARILEGREKSKWEEADEVHFFKHTQGLNQPAIREMWRIAYCKYYKIPLKGTYGQGTGKTDDKNYNSFSANLHRVIIVGCLDPKAYTEYRDSGMSVTAVWAKITGTGKKRHARIAEGEESAGHKGDMIKQIEKDVEEGVENAKELLEGAVRSSKPGRAKKSEMSEISDKKDGDETKSWNANIPNENTRWMKECRQILRDDPMLFIRMIEQCVNVGLLSEKVLTLVRKEMIKK